MILARKPSPWHCCLPTPQTASEHQERVSVCTDRREAQGASMFTDESRAQSFIPCSPGVSSILSTLLCVTIFAAVALRPTLKILKATSSSSCLPVKVGLSCRLWNISSLSILADVKLILERERMRSCGFSWFRATSASSGFNQHELIIIITVHSADAKQTLFVASTL